MHPDDPRTPSPRDEHAFNAWLDALVTDPSTSVTSASADPSSARDLAEATSAARQFHELARAAADATARPTTSNDPHDTWEHILMAHQSPAPLAAPIPLSSPTRPHATMQRLNRFLSIAAVLALLIGAASTAWLHRGSLGLGGGGNDPQGPTDLAAITLPNGQTVEVAYDVPTADDCTVAPLTVDEVMTKLDTPYSALDVLGIASPVAYSPMPDDVYDTVAELQREWLACALFGSPLQRWALESNRLVRQEIQNAYFPVINMAVIEADLTALARGEEVARFQSPTITDGAELPMLVPQVDGAPSFMVNGTNAFLTVIWVRTDGTILTPSGTREDLEPYQNASFLEQSLPNTWRFVNVTDGEWLLDQLEVMRG